MHVLNIHKREFDLPITELASMISTLSSSKDEVWPNKKWPRMKLDNGLVEDSNGGHGPIGYFVKSYSPNEIIFQFTRPKGFNGIHKFNINKINANRSELVHTIDINIQGKALLLWHFGIRSLHDALIEDGLDKIHNKITGSSKVTKWNLWVRILRGFLK